MGNKGAHIIVGRVKHDFFGLAVLHDLAVFHDRNAASQLERFVQIMADKYNGLVQLVLQFQQLVLKALADQRVQRREGFIHQQDIGVHRQRPRQAHPLLHAAAQLIGLFVAPLGQAHQFELLIHQSAPFLFRAALHLQAEADVFAHRQPGHQGEFLKHHGNAFGAHHLQFGGGTRGDVDLFAFVLYIQLATADRIEPVDATQQAGLA